MTSKIKHLLLLLSLIFVSCGTVKTLENHEENVLEYSSMHYTLNRIFSYSQVDSMIVADKLSPLNDWIISQISYQGKITNQYLFIKSLKKDGELIYTVTDLNNNTYKCTKRITENK